MGYTLALPCRKCGCDINVPSKEEKAMKDALVRDIVVSIKWAGAADLELAVTEPDGSVCGFRNKLTKNGGVLVKQ